MLKRLCALSNKLDKAGLHDLSDEIDSILKQAVEKNSMFDQIDALFNSLARSWSRDKKDSDKAKSDIVAQYVSMYTPDAVQKIEQRMAQGVDIPAEKPVNLSDPYAPEPEPNRWKHLEEFDRENAEEWEG